MSVLTCPQRVPPLHSTAFCSVARLFIHSLGQIAETSTDKRRNTEPERNLCNKAAIPPGYCRIVQSQRGKDSKGCQYRQQRDGDPFPVPQPACGNSAENQLNKQDPQAFDAGRAECYDYEYIRN